ncbi:SCO0607 family lipoprotein [Streptomyces physcomitrii]|uniref:Lipoprotein n=1 Tax=Streptomyces albus (strain ATCC 21838 / DSM 41398 / FERM P-419 / JCM 4703 / NBRC 107858) TaxID=1081613 RepID=A0A0B5EVV6_STRA4|nr:lipoprotein [Streptomyces albus]AOU80222.1 lipoprotein [Streptomyces albus]
MGTQQTRTGQRRIRQRAAGGPARFPAAARLAARTAGLAAATALAGAGLAACSIEEASCGGGEYPVQAVGSTGSACAEKGEKPPKGYVRYPEGKVPEKVGDKWDTYWNTHIIEKDGSVRKAREGE